MTISINSILKFWAKTSDDPEKRPNAYHPLICHMIDVACVALLMWREVLPEVTKRRLAKPFGLTCDSTACDHKGEKCPLHKAGIMIAFFAGLHDLGKCSPPFQFRGKNDASGFKWLKNRIDEELNKGNEKDSFYLKRLNGRLQTIKFLDIYKQELCVPESVPTAIDVPHGFVATIELPEILESYGFNESIRKRVSILIGGHHGVFPDSEWNKNGSKAIDDNLGTNWQPYRKALTKILADLLEITPIEQETSAKLDNGTAMILAGLVSVADWIGSNTDFFECEVDDFESDFNFNDGAYLTKAKSQAREALKRLGWLNWANYDEPKDFFELFPNLEKYPMRDLQVQAVAIANDLKSNGIVVIESPMGEGKTEAAMFLADHFNYHLKHRGIYFALPTQATSNQMFGRVTRFLEERFERGLIQTQLLHGHSSLSSQLESLKRKFGEIQDIYDECCGDDCVPNVVASEWFSKNGKQGILVPFGVGTVDQSLLSVLRTKHVFVRLFGLAHKTVIIDEVHAYDAYMSTLLERLLEWLAALGSPVILLSATLPKERRNTLINAYQRGLGIREEDVESVDKDEDIYPRISYSTDSKIKIKHITSSSKTQNLKIKKIAEIIEEDSEGNPQICHEFVKRLERKLEQGGCLAIICNSVSRSQTIYELLSKTKLFQDESQTDGLRKDQNDGFAMIDLLHSRFPFYARDEIETRIRIRYGKPNEIIKTNKGGKDKEVKVRRPKCSVLVATQIIEQSLDIDFDLMISDIAPIDLLLQRAGRLQRHDRESTDVSIADRRPSTFVDEITGRPYPELWLINPSIGEDGLPDFSNAFVYDDHVLLRTWLELNREQYSTIQIPHQVEDLIEAVYDFEKIYSGADDRIRDFWQTTLAEYQSALQHEQTEAENRFIRRPIYSRHISGIFSNDLEEDSPEIHRSLQAVTRLTEPTVAVVCLWGKHDRVYVDEEMTREIDLTTKPGYELTRRLLTCSMNISSKKVVFDLLAEPSPPGWKKSPHLRHHRVLKFNEQRECLQFGFKFSLDGQLGLKIIEPNKYIST